MAQRRIHFVGIGGIGMSALARYFKHEKWAVSGSDAAKSQITASLIKEGVRVKFGHKKAYISRNMDFVVYNRAIPQSNPELVAARRLHVPTLPYAEALGEITERYLTIAISGSHGKSTTTALAGLTLLAGGLDPTILIGTNLHELGNKNIRIGRSPYLVLEADDFGAAFTHYSPAIAIVMNIDHEHLDFYKTFSNLQNAFLKFMARTGPHGLLILNRDDKDLFSLRTRIAAIAKKRTLHVIWYSLRDNEAKKIKRAITVPGTHNLSNALAAYVLGAALGIPEKKILRAIGSYHGAWRRMEYRGIFRGERGSKGAAVYDDYAHHPTEIKATLQAFREKFPGKKIVCVFQPHQAKRLAALFKEFTASFTDADATLLLPIYKVAGRDEKPSKLDSQALARAVQKRERKKLFFYLADPRKLKDALRTVATPLSQCVIVMMGAGNIVQLTDALVK